MYVKFVISGLTATITHFTILLVLTELFKVWYVASASVGFVIAFLVSFNMQKFWTFRDNSRDRIYNQATLYLFTALAGACINAAAMYALVDKFEIYYIYAQVVIGAFIAVGNFLVYRFFIFKTQKKEVKEEAIDIK